MTSILPDSLEVIEEASEESSVVTSLTAKTKNSLRPSNGLPSLLQSPNFIEASVTKTRSRRSVPISPVQSPGSETEGRTLSIPLSVGSIPMTMAAGDITAEQAKESVRRKTGKGNSSPRRVETASDSKESYDYSHYEDKIRQMKSASEEENNEVLAWRMDPADSLSDWTIRVTNKDDNQIHNFHVHKNVLAAGKRKSEYFVNIFQRNSPKTQFITDVGFSTAAIKAMPCLLDYMYSTKPPRISSEWAMGLRFLAQFFGVKLLFKIVMEFIQKDLCMSTILPYCRDSISLKDEKMMGVSARHIGRNILQLPEDHPVLDLIDPSFLMKVVLVTGFESEGRDLHRGKIVTAYIEKRRHTMDEDTFSALTTEDVLPVFYPKTALTLLGLEVDIVKSIKDSDVLTPLQTRCIRDLALHWTELSEADPEQTTHIMSKLPTHVVSELLVKSLSSARKNNSKHKKSTPDTSRNSNSPVITPSTLKIKVTRGLLKGLSSPGRLFIRESTSPLDPNRTILKLSPRRPASQDGNSPRMGKKDTAGDQQRSNSRDRRESSENRSKNDRGSGHERRSGHSRNSDQDRRSGHTRSSDRDRRSGHSRKSDQERRSGHSRNNDGSPSRALEMNNASAKEVGSPRRTLGPKSASTREKASPSKVRESLSRNLGSKSRSLRLGRDRSSSESPRRSKRDEPRADVDLLKAKHNLELVKLKHEYENNLAKLRDMCLEKDKHIALYWEEIRRYVRLPNDARLTSSGVLNGGPTKMPDIGNQPRDGQLFSDKKGTKYAVFYYKCD